MGTHPIFESDFDCLTEIRKNGSAESLHKQQKDRNRRASQKLGR